MQMSSFLYENMYGLLKWHRILINHDGRFWPEVIKPKIYRQAAILHTHVSDIINAWINWSLAMLQ